MEPHELPLLERLRATANGDPRIEAAADEIEKLRGLLRQAVEAYDGGDLQMSSPDIDGGEDEYNDPYPPHPWHEEWLSYAREASQ